MAKCQVCAYDNEEGAEYCEECGVKLGSAPCAPALAAAAPPAPPAPIDSPPEPVIVELEQVEVKAVGSSKACPACGHEVAEGIKFCPKCGIRMDGEPPATAGAAASKKCPSCNLEADPGALFCSSCGTRIGGGEVPQPARPKPKGEVIRLRMVAGKDKDRVFEVEKTEIRLGRLTENDIPLENDGYVSSKHTRISKQGNEFFVEDLGSTNGTFLKVRKLTRIVPGDEVKIGQSIFRLE